MGRSNGAIAVAVPASVAQGVVASAVLPGSVWRNLGSNGHPRGVEVTVVALTTAGRVRFIRHTPGRQANSERKLTMEEPAFRACHELVKQPATRQATRALVRGISDTLVGRGLLDLDAVRRQEVMNDVVQSLRPTTPSSPEASVASVAQEPADDVAPTPEGAPPDDLPTESAADAPDDPLEDFMAHGRATIERLTQTLARTEEDREIARLELEELDERLVGLRGQRERVEQAIEAALAVAGGQILLRVGAKEPAFPASAPPEAPEPAPEPAPAPAPEEAGAGTGFAPTARSLEARAIIEPPARRSGRRRPSRALPATPGLNQVAWIGQALRARAGGEPFTIADLAPAYMEAFGFTDPEYGRSRLSILVGKVRRHERSAGTVDLAVERLNRSTYRVLAPAGAQASPVEEAGDAEPDSAPETAAAPPEPASEASPEGSKRDWVAARFEERRLWAMRQLVPAYAEAFGLDPEPARQSLSGLISEWAKPDRVGHPKLHRIAKGLYEAVA